MKNKNKSIDTITKLKQDLKKKYPFISEEEELMLDSFLRDLPGDPKERYDYLVAGLEDLKD